MDIARLYEALDELMELPLNECNIERLAHLTTAIHYLSRIEPPEIEPEVTELVETVEIPLEVIDYYLAKTAFRNEPTEEHRVDMVLALAGKLAVVSSEIRDILANRDLDDEKQEVVKFANEVHLMSIS